MEFYIAISVITIVVLIVAIVRLNDASKRVDAMGTRISKITDMAKKNVWNTLLVLMQKSSRSYGLNFTF